MLSVPAVDLSHVRVAYGQRVVLDRLDLSLSPGERLAVTGPNGSGKTTLLRCIVGTLTPASGSVSIFGHGAGSPAAARLTGVSLAQERAFYLRLSGRQNLEFFAGVRAGNRAHASAMVADLERELEITELLGRRLEDCSTGMLQQLAFARALLGAPSLLVLDEPTRSLDELAIARTWEALDRRPSCVIVVVSHREQDIARCGQRLSLPQ